MHSFASFTRLPFSSWLCLTMAAALLTAITFLFQWHYQNLLEKPAKADANDLQAVLAAQVTPPPTPLITAHQLYALALMGRVNIAKPKSPPALEDLPVTQKMLTLSGVFASDQGTIAAALIKVNDNLPSYFTLGSEVIPGTQLFSVTNNGVTLKSEEGFEKLVFKRHDIWVSSTANNLLTPAPTITTPNQSPSSAPVSLPEHHHPNRTAHRYLPDVPQVADGTLEERLLQIRDALKR